MATGESNLSPAIEATSQGWVGGNLGRGWDVGGINRVKGGVESRCFLALFHGHTLLLQPAGGRQRSGAQASVAAASPRVGQRRRSVLALSLRAVLWQARGSRLSG